MKTLRVIRCKPNPMGKDRSRNGRASAIQLGAEWVDVQNTGSSWVSLEGVKLYHIAYGSDGEGNWSPIFMFKGGLPHGEIVRVHSGGGTQLHQQDLVGADYHLFTGMNYVWNNSEGDCPALFEQNIEIDKACYSSNPTEGAILYRVGSQLVVASVGASARR